MNQKFVECPNCGHNWTDAEKVCKYCGSANPNYKEPSVISNVLSDFNSNDSSNNLKKNNFSVILFVILMVFCWPIGIIYLILCLKK